MSRWSHAFQQAANEKWGRPDDPIGTIGKGVMAHPERGRLPQEPNTILFARHDADSGEETPIERADNDPEPIASSLCADDNSDNSANSSGQRLVNGLVPSTHDPSPVWDAADGRAFFAERAAIAEHDGGLPRAKAEARAFECCVTEWANRNPEPSEPGCCALCGGKPEEYSVIVPFGTEAHTWLHHRCWPVWYEERRSKSVMALAAMGIAVSP